MALKSIIYFSTQTHTHTLYQHIAIWIAKIPFLLGKLGTLTIYLELLSAAINVVLNYFQIHKTPIAFSFPNTVITY